MSRDPLTVLLVDGDTDAMFNHAPKIDPLALFKRLNARFGLTDIDLLRRIVARDTADAVRMANEV